MLVIVLRIILINRLGMLVCRSGHQVSRLRSKRQKAPFQPPVFRHCTTGRRRWAGAAGRTVANMDVCFEPTGMYSRRVLPAAPAYRLRHEAPHNTPHGTKHQTKAPSQPLSPLTRARNHLPRHIPRIIRRQKHHHIRHLPHLSRAPKGFLRGQLLEQFHRRGFL